MAFLPLLIIPVGIRAIRRKRERKEGKKRVFKSNKKRGKEGRKKGRNFPFQRDASNAKKDPFFITGF